MADRFARSQRMQKHWHVIPGASIAFTSSATGIGGSLALDGPFTVIRMLGEYVLAPNGALTALDSASVIVAIGVVSTDAVAVGASAMPDPGSEPDYPWLFWAAHELFYPGTNNEAAVASASIRRPFDIKSMRKMKPRESLVMVAQYFDNVGAPAIQFLAAQTRVLVAD